MTLEKELMVKEQSISEHELKRLHHLLDDEVEWITNSLIGSLEETQELNGLVPAPLYDRVVLHYYDVAVHAAPFVHCAALRVPELLRWKNEVSEVAR